MAINLQIELSDGQLQPVTRYDAERMEEYANGQLFNIKRYAWILYPHYHI